MTLKAKPAADLLSEGLPVADDAHGADPERHS
jgi:hypothetical protein